jgi:hypothetical protein
VGRKCPPLLAFATDELPSGPRSDFPSAAIVGATKPSRTVSTLIWVRPLETSPNLDAEAGEAAARRAEAEAAPRSLRTTDRLALAIFGLLRSLSVGERRLVLSELDAVDRRARAPRERVALRALERCRTELHVAVPSKGRYERWRLSLKEPGVPSATFVAGTFGGWARALDAAGLEPTVDLRVMRLRAMVKLASDEEILDGLRQCAEDLGQPLRFGVYREWARVREMQARDGQPVLPLSPSSFLSRFGSFANALASAGLDCRVRGPRVAHADNRELGNTAVRAAHQATAPAALTFDAYAAWRSRELARLEEEGHVRVAIPASNTLRRAHGSWNGVLAAAGLMTQQRAAQGYRGRGRKLTDELVAQSVLLAVKELGPDIQREEYFQWRKRKLLQPDAPRLASLSGITKRPGGWGDALHKAATARDAAEAGRPGAAAPTDNGDPT